LFDTDKPITVLHNSVQVLPELPFDNRAAEQVVFSGTLAHKKGIFSLLKTWNMVAQQFPAATLTVYGKGDIQPLQALLEPDYLFSVHFMGHQPRERLFHTLGTATLAVFPSYSETFGLTPVEAMSLGCPVIFTRYSCGPEIVHDGQTGLLADPDHPEDIAAAICRLLQDSALRKALSKAGREDVLQRFDVRRSAIVHLHYYEQVITAFNHGRNG
jgi:glycosyltransferase involved in cell wall biosynthesis